MEKHLWLDLDETLVHGEEHGDSVIPRPHLETLLRFTFENFATVNIWTAASRSWFEQVFAEELSPALPPSHREFHHVWCGDRCVNTVDYDAVDNREFYQPYYQVKPLVKVWRRYKFMNCHNTLIVDNTPTTYERNYGNAIPIDDFEGDAKDAELLKLTYYLPTLLPLPSVRYTEKRFWSGEVDKVAVYSMTNQTDGCSSAVVNNLPSCS